MKVPFIFDVKENSFDFISRNISPVSLIINSDVSLFLTNGKVVATPWAFRDIHMSTLKDGLFHGGKQATFFSVMYSYK